MICEPSRTQRGTTQAIKSIGGQTGQIAELFGVTQPRVSDLKRRKIEVFGLDALVDMAAVAGLRVKTSLTGRKRSKQCYVGATVGALMLGKFLIEWCARRDSNPRPPGS